MKTPAAILNELHKPLELDEVEIPALKYGQVLTQVDVTRICGTQVGEIDGFKGPDRFLPHLLGHEGGGRVLETGPGVRHVKKDDHVVLHWRPSQGIQCEPPQYKRGTQKVNAGWVTTFNRYAIVSENRLTVIPNDIDDELAALMADTLTTGFGLINNDAKVKIGESVVVFGSGGIGQGAILGAKLAGAHPIVAIDLFDNKLEAAKKHGATHAINAHAVDNVEDWVRSIVGGAGADVVIDGTGNAKVIETCYSLTQPKGRCVLFGVMPSEKRVNIHTLPLHHGKILTGVEGGQSQPHLDIPRYLRMIEAGLFDTKDFVSHRGQLEDVNDLIGKMRNGEVLHAVMRLEGGAN